MRSRGDLLAKWLRPEELVGLLVALLFLSGRWSPARLVETTEVSILAQLRFWIVAALVLVSLLPGRRGRAPVPAQRPHLQFTSRVLLMIAAYLIYLSFTVGWAPDLALGMTKAAELLLTLVTLVLIYRWLVIGEPFLLVLAFWKWLLLLTLAMGAVAVSGLVAGSDMVRTSVLAGGPNTFGRMMGLLCLAAIFAWVRHGHTWAWIPVAITAVCLTVVSGSRGAMLSVAVAVVAFLVLARIQLSRLMAMVIVGSLAVFLILGYTSLGQVASELFASRVIRLSLQNRYVAGRDVLYQDAIDLGLEAPFAGAGIGSFRARGLGPYPHNMFLESFAEGGAIGVALLVILLVGCGVGIYRRRGQLDAVTISALCLATLFSQFSGDLYDNRMVFILLILATVPDPAVLRDQPRIHAPRLTLGRRFAGF